MSTFISNGVLSNGTETIDLTERMSSSEIQELVDAIREFFDPLDYDSEPEDTVDIDSEEFTAFEFAKAVYEKRIAKCVNCDEWHAVDEMIKCDDEYYCDDCRDNLGIFYCEHCEEYHHEDEENPVYDNRGDIQYSICDDCLRTGPFYYCDACNKLYHNDDLYSDDHGNHICYDCYEGNYTTCESCGRIIQYDDSVYDENDECSYCESCWEERGHSEHIHNYYYKPSVDFKWSDNDNRRAHPLQEGIELEFNHEDPSDCRDGADDWYRIDGEDWFYLKHDGSLENGYEAVSHPASLLYWREHKDYLEKLLRTAEGNGAIAGEGCGLHIHVGKNAMSDVHKMRLQTFVNENADNLVKIARREHSHWAKFKKVLNNPLCILKQDIEGQPDRYEALNWLNRNTVEFRFFKSTLCVNTLLACIEFVHASYVFTKNFLHFNDIRRGNSWQMFLDWIKGRKEYEELCAFYG